MKNFRINKRVDKFLKNDNALKIVSLFIAIILFISVNQIGNPLWANVFSTTDYIDDVPLEINYDEDKYVVTGAPSSIAVNVKGSQNDVNAQIQNSESLVGTLSLNYKSPGDYTINTSQIRFNNSSNVTIQPAVNSIDLEIQQRVSVSEPVDISYINGQGADSGYLLDLPTLSNSTVEIEGGNKDVNSVVSVIGMINLSNLSADESSGEQEFEVDLVPYDKDGQVVSEVSLNPSSITVTQPYSISTVELPVNYDFINNDTGKYVSSICEIDDSTDGSCSKDASSTVEVYGNQEKISQMDSVTYKVDMTGISGNSATVSATPEIDSGVYVLGDYEKEFNITLEKGETKTFDDVQPIIFGLDQTLQATAANSDEAAVDVTITGAKSVIDELSADDIVLTLDMSDIDSTGTASVPIATKNDDDFDYELSQDFIKVEITEKD